MIPAIIQARMSSSRLPGKVLRLLGGATVLSHVVRHVSRAGAQPVVCTSKLASDDPIEAHCNERGIVCIRGPLDDVVQRFSIALEHPEVVQGDWFYRVTADCPLLSATLCQELWRARAEDLDFIGIDQSAVPTGVSAELIRRSSFEDVAKRDLTPQQREHVTVAMYEDPDAFTCQRLQPPPAYFAPNLRLTLDTVDDFALLSRLFDKNPNLTATEAIEALNAELNGHSHAL